MGHADDCADWRPTVRDNMPLVAGVTLIVSSLGGGLWCYQKGWTSVPPATSLQFFGSAVIFGLALGLGIISLLSWKPR